MYASGVMTSQLAGWHTHVGCEYVSMVMCVCMYLHAVCMNCDIVEAHSYVVITSESILMSKFVAESINQTTNCRTFLA